MTSLDDGICKHMCKCACVHLCLSVCTLAICTCQSVYIPNSLLLIVGMKHCFISHTSRVGVDVHYSWLSDRHLECPQLHSASVCVLDCKCSSTSPNATAALCLWPVFCLFGSISLSQVVQYLSGPACQRRA